MNKIGNKIGFKLWVKNRIVSINNKIENIILIPVNTLGDKLILWEILYTVLYTPLSKGCKYLLPIQLFFIYFKVFIFFNKNKNFKIK